MKRLICLVFGLFVFFSAGVTALAVEYETYRLTELDLELEFDIPSDYIVITRETAKDDPCFAQIGASAEIVFQYMKDNNVYLDIINPEDNCEIFVTLTESPISDLSDMSDKDFAELCSTFVENANKSGMEDYKNAEYVHDSIRYIVANFWVELNGVQSYRTQYYTAYNAVSINVIMVNYFPDGAKTKSRELREFVDRIRFQGLSPAPEPEAELSPAITYTDEESGVVFTVPGGWHEESVEGAKRVDAKFVHDQSPDTLILYTCEDLYGDESFWQNLAEDFQAEISRGDIDNSLLTTQAVSEMFGCPEDEISQIALGSMEYFRVDQEHQQYGISLPCTTLTCYHNGYLYMYMFFGGEGHPCFSDFREMMENIEYPAVEKEKDLFAPFHPANILISLILTLAIYSLPIFIYRWSIRRYPVEQKKAKIIVIVYGIVSWIAMSAIIFTINGEGAAGGSAVFLWGWINYFVLTRGKDRRAVQEHFSAPAQDDDPWTKPDRPGPGGKEF